MKVEVKTANWHEFNADGSQREKHCCGCWHFVLDEDQPTKPYASCNECGEVREAKFEGITQ